MGFRVSFFAVQQSSKLGGWSENFWNAGTDVDTVNGWAAILRDRLTAVAGAQAYFPYYRISSVEPPRQVLLTNVGGSGPKVESSVYLNADYPATALQLKLSAPGGYQTTQWLRGIPDDIVKNSGRYNPVDPFLSNFNALVAELTNTQHTWAINCLDRTVIGTPIQGINNVTGIVQANGHGLGATGATALVRISRVVGLTYANRLWSVTVIDGNNVQCNQWQSQTAVMLPSKKATMRKQKYILVQIGRAVNGIISTHYTGRPSNLLGGRRRRRRT